MQVTTGFGIDPPHYLNLFHMFFDCKCCHPETYFNDHFKISFKHLNFAVPKTNLKHFGQYVDPNTSLSTIMERMKEVLPHVLRECTGVFPWSSVISWKWKSGPLYVWVDN
jgi:hypothetical protein